MIYKELSVRMLGSFRMLFARIICKYNEVYKYAAS